MMKIRTIRGGITAVAGIRAAGLWAGIKKNRKPDLALIVSDEPAAAAALFTQNRFHAAPLIITRRHLRGGRLQAIIANSGIANAGTGPAGLRHAAAVARETARLLHLPTQRVAVASTGLIGGPLPVDTIRRALPRLVGRLTAHGSHQAAQAIMTTDTVPKEVAVEARIGGSIIRVGGIAKGSGMIHPRLATMLAFLATDAPISPALLRRALSQAADPTFNAITVDGETSTNDLVLCLATGQAPGAAFRPGSSHYRQFCRLLTEACHRLALCIIDNAEGATKRVAITVKGAASMAQARRIGRAVAQSLLVKTALFGSDPNWGRIISAIGASGARVREDEIDIAYGPVTVVRRGRGTGATAERRAARQLRRREVQLAITLHSGSGAATIWTCDLSTTYVRINAHYHT